MYNSIIFMQNEAETVAFGATLAVTCQQACVIYIYGDLSAGKTTFCRGFLRALGHRGNVKSPTYTIVESYVLPYWTVYHFDLYRLEDPKELEFIGVRDYFNNTDLFLIEWPQRGRGILPAADIALTIAYQGSGRQIQVQALSVTGACILAQLTLRQETLS